MMQLSTKGAKGHEGTRMGLWGAAQAIAFGLGGILGTGASDLRGGSWARRNQRMPRFLSLKPCCSFCLPGAQSR